MNAEDKAQLQKVGAMIADLSEKLDALNWIHGEILGHLAKIAGYLAPLAPNYRRQLSEYAAFVWPDIGATIVEGPKEAPAVVEWNGHRFKRRSGNGKYGEAVWYSRPVGKSEDGAEYARLITFKDLDEVEPLNPAVKAIHDPPPQAERSISQDPEPTSNLW